MCHIEHETGAQNSYAIQYIVVLQMLAKSATYVYYLQQEYTYIQIRVDAVRPGVVCADVGGPKLRRGDVNGALAVVDADSPLLGLDETKALWAFGSGRGATGQDAIAVGQPA